MTFIANMACRFVTFALVTVATMTVSAQRMNISDFSNCFTLAPVKYNAYIGWPYKLTCDIFPIEYEYDLVNSRVQCSIWNFDNGTLLYSEELDLDAIYDYDELNSLEYDIPQVDQNETRYILKYNLIGESNCSTIEVWISAKELKASNCNNSVQTYIEENRRILKPVLKHSFIVDCKPTLMTEIKLYGEDFNYTWYKNCQPLLGHQNGTRILKTGQIVFERISYEDHGFYTCAAEFNDMTRYVVTAQLCIEREGTSTVPTIVCADKTMRTDIGEDVVISCIANLGTGEKGSLYVLVDWEQISSLPSESRNLTECSIHVGLKSASVNNERANCNLTFLGDFSSQPECYDYVPGLEDQIQDPSDLVMELHIKNIKPSDLGLYQVKVQVPLKGLNYAIANVILTKNEETELRSTALVTGVCIAILLVILLATFFIWWNIFYVKLYFRRKFEKIKEDNKEHGAFLSYQYSTSFNDRFAQEIIKTAVTQTTSMLKALGYTVYDENKDGVELELRAENCIEIMKRSHRVVIFMTSQYLNDHWSVYTLQKAFEQMLKANLTLVFILLPGIKEYIKQRVSTNPTYALILRLLKKSEAIYWSDEDKFDVKLYRMRLEYAMPKLFPFSEGKLADIKFQNMKNPIHYLSGSTKKRSTESKLIEKVEENRA